MKKFIQICSCICLVAMMLCSFVVPVKASAGYEYESLDVHVEVNDRREYKVSEKMVIHFMSPMHGIIRDIPMNNGYEAWNVKDISVTGMPFTKEITADGFAIKIGDPDNEIQGTKEITLTYTLAHYQDDDPKEDFIHINLLGTDYDADVKAFHGDIEFPNKEKLKDIQVTSGENGSTDNEYTTFTQQGNHLIVDSQRYVGSGIGISAKLHFENGIFPNAPQYEYSYVIRDQSKHITIDEKQNIQVEEQLTYDTSKSLANIQIPFICDDWEVADYDVTDVKIETDGDYDYTDSGAWIRTQKSSGTVKLSYHIHPHRVYKNELYLKLNNEEQDTYIEHSKIAITTPDTPNATILLKRDGSDLDTSFIKTSVNDHTMDVETTDVIKHGASYGIMLKINDGVYQRTSSMMRILMLGLSAGLLILYLFLRFVKYRKETPIAPVNFYPPKGMNSAEASYVIDEKLTYNDVASLIFYWADKGYLSIHYSEHGYLFERNAAPSTSAPFYEAKLFEKMFSYGKGGLVGKSDLKYRFYRDVEQASRELMDIYDGKKGLDDPKAYAVRSLCITTSIFPLSLYLYDCVKQISENHTLAMGILAISVIPWILSLLMVLISKKPHKPYKIDVPVMTYWLELFIYVIGGIFFVIVYDFDMMMLAAPILSIVLFMIAKGIRKNSDYRSEMLSSLLGFQEFLKTTEKDRLEMLLEEDPEYYYHILPYAQVLHVSDMWIHKFENIVVPSPTWYDGDERYEHRMMYDIMKDIQSDMKDACASPENNHTSSTSSSSGGSGTGSGSGGGGSHGW